VSKPIALSVILPAYNEAARLPPHLTAVREYLQARYPDRHEVIVVDDGSGDGLAAILDGLAAGWPQLRVLRHARNQGKGGAVRTGMLAADGELLLFSDADGATPIKEESRLAAAILAGADLAVGSRLLSASTARRSRTWIRGLAGRSFAAVARRLLCLSVRDTQCGFKMFRRDAGRRLFSLLHERRYLFDLEVLATANRLGYRTA
jgi:dolichyl-phosphate beta-glucosyltransferase